MNKFPSTIELKPSCGSVWRFIPMHIALNYLLAICSTSAQTNVSPQTIQKTLQEQISSIKTLEATSALEIDYPYPGGMYHDTNTNQIHKRALALFPTGWKSQQTLLIVIDGKKGIFENHFEQVNLDVGVYKSKLVKKFDGKTGYQLLSSEIKNPPEGGIGSVDYATRLIDNYWFGQPRLLLEAITQGQATLKSAGSVSVVVETSKPGLKTIYYLDPAKGYQAIRREDYSDQGLPIVAEDTEFQKVSENIWFPKNGTRTFFRGTPDDSGSREILAVQFLRVEYVSINKPLKNRDFRIHFPKGTLITDLRAPVPKRFYVHLVQAPLWIKVLSAVLIILFSMFALIVRRWYAKNP